MKILITGATGFIGAQAVVEALSRGHRVLALSRTFSPAIAGESRDCETIGCDLSIVGNLNLGGLDIDAVVHLAASLSGDAQEQYQSTVHGTENLLDAMRQAGIRRLVGVSSFAVLDYAASAPMSVIDERNSVARNVLEMGTYAAAKAAQEALFHTFAMLPGSRCIILRPALVYDETHLINAHAGIVRGRLCVLVKHAGEVPVISVAAVARSILDAIEREVDSGEVIHLVDDGLPDQAAYIAALRRRGLLPVGSIEVPWRVISGLTTLLNKVAGVFGLREQLPEALRPQSFAARMKPFRYSNAKARQLLGWVPDRRFS